ncbi:hypothetical protein [Actinomycetospora cinnamomea]|uniref:Regulator of septum formation n=1 Tax=Actinomycetospora cinnamomea TaxID=663609 RepID=A0A2U1FRQ4_9PSEU|nr:hypothetical protein [Actinomycetospora cinnamomea]PVZ14839.1 hypothetical protein C8D89_101707 [Actinomycetospora cinnamomea]
MSRPVALAAGAAALAVLLLLVGALMGGWRPFTAQPDVLTYGPDGDLEQFVLFEGQCANGDLASGGSFGPEADARCGVPHDVEVVASIAPVREGRPVSYPGEEGLAAFGRAYCALYADSDLLVPTAGGVDRDDLRMTAVVPARAAFADPRSAGSASGGRQVSCVVSRDDGERLTDRFSVI